MAPRRGLGPAFWAAFCGQRLALESGLLFIGAAAEGHSASPPGEHTAAATDAEGSGIPRVAVVSASSPGSLRGNYAGLFATFSAWPLPKDDFDVWVPSSSPEGCTRYTLPQALPGGRSGVALVRRGNCTFLQKALVASEAGAAGLVVVSDSDEVTPMGIANNDTQEVQESQDVDIFVVGVGKTEGEKMRSWSLAHQRNQSSGDEVSARLANPVVLSFASYKSSLLDPAEVILVCLATILVAAGAQFSTSDLKEQGTLSAAIAAPEEEVLEVDTWTALGFFAMGSCFLMILFFFMKYLIYVIIFAFCLGGASCISQFASICLQHFLPMLKSRVASVPGMGTILQADVIAMLPALILPACWLFLRNTPYGWPFQDIIGAGFLCWLQRTLRLPDMKIATLFLILMFFFDIFWVFISPLIFQQSVMVTVATGGGTGESVPMLLRIPSLADPLGNDRLLGFGDIALPGLLVSYLRRHDLLCKRRLAEGYFLPALAGYFIGLCATICALVVMHMGQPALLYLVPGTLGTTLCLALGRGELDCLWEGSAAKTRDGGPFHEASDIDGP